MIELNIFSIILILGIVQGVFLVVSLFLIRNRNKGANQFLSAFILLITLTMLGRLIIESDLEISFPNILALPDAIIFLYGPIMYLYLLKLCTNREFKFAKTIKHFLPAIIFLVSELPLLFQIDHQFRETWTRYTTVRFILIEGGALVVNIYYLFLYKNLLNTYEDESNNHFSIRQHPKYLRVISNIMAVTLIVWGVSYFSWITGNYNIFSQIGYRTVWIILPFLTYAFGYYAMNQPALFKVINKKEKPNTDTQIDQSVLEDWKKTLEKFMLEEMPYLNPNLTLKMLSDDIGLKPYQTSKLINTVYEKNFNDFINGYRIEEFKKRATADGLKKKTILSFALEAGFNSKTTFNTAFKKLTNTTPLQYLKSR